MRIPLYILTGFLGSGKTTLLNRCLGDVRFADSAVLINEFGEIALDHLLVESVDEEVLVLGSGCVCCNVRDDFTAALLDLAARREQSDKYRFQRAILETTGIADPNAIHQVLLTDPEIRQRYRHAGTIVVVDAVFGSQYLNQHPEAVLQVAVANGLLMSKTDLATNQQIARLEDQLCKINSTALRVQDGELANILDILGSDSHALASLPISSVEAEPASVQHTHRFSTFTVRHAEPITWSDLRAWLEALLFARGADIYRIKGLVEVKDRSQPLVVNSVHHALYEPQYLDSWPDDKRSTELTFICKNFTATAASRSLLQVCSGVDSSADDAVRHVTPAKPQESSLLRRTIVPGVSDRLVAHFQQPSSLDMARPWHHWSLHNPWSLASTVIDSWDVLSIAQAPELVAVVAELIGSDIVLFDSRIQPVRFGHPARWENDAWRFPVDPLAGAVARLPLTSLPVVCFRSGDTSADVEFAQDEFVVHDARLDYCFSETSKHVTHYEWVYHYFPATSKYIRDPMHQLHRALAEEEPLINHAGLPLWLVNGNDRAENDFVTGFQTNGAFWSAA